MNSQKTRRSQSVRSALVLQKCITFLPAAAGVVLLAAAGAPRAGAATIDYWLGGTNAWSTKADWSTGALPGATGNAVIGSGGTVTVNGTQSAASLIIGNNASTDPGNGELAVSYNAAKSTGSVTISGASSVGTIAGSGTYAGTLSVDNSAGPALFTTSSLAIGPTGTAILTLISTSNGAPIAASGAITLDPASSLYINDAATLGTFNLASYGGALTGTFGAVYLDGTAEITDGGTTGPDLTLDYGTGSNSAITVTVNNVSGLPEPGAAAILGIAGCGLLKRHRRRTGQRFVAA